MRRLLLVLLVLSVLALPVLVTLGRESGPARPQVALIDITGIITETSSDSRFSGAETGARDVIQHLRTVQDNPRFAAVILRIDSPGGSPAAAQEIYHAIRRTQARGKPVVVSMASSALSAAYYVAAPADAILANPSTLTGSIGAVVQVLVIHDLLERYGIDTETIASGPYKDAGSPYRPLEPWQRELYQQLVHDVWDQFVMDVAAGRGLDVETVRALADGRPFSGRQAQALGLVDRLGGLEDAVAVAQELAGLDQRPVLVPLGRPRSLYDRLLGAIGASLGEALVRRAASDWMISFPDSPPAGAVLEWLDVPVWGYRLR